MPPAALHYLPGLPLDHLKYKSLTLPIMQLIVKYTTFLRPESTMRTTGPSGKLTGFTRVIQGRRKLSFSVYSILFSTKNIKIF